MAEEIPQRVQERGQLSQSGVIINDPGQISAAGVIMSRLAGIALIGLGVACWPGKSNSCGVAGADGVRSTILTVDVKRLPPALRSTMAILDR